jgi:putative ABC transport system permease protein
MVTDYFKMAWRNLVRGKLNTILNILGLTLGITCFLIIFSKTDYERSFERFHSD